MIEKLNYPRINDSCSCGRKDCIFCDPIKYEERQTKWNTCRICGYDERTKTDKQKYVMNGLCNKCREKEDRKYDFKNYAEKEGRVTRDDEIMCPYCGFVLEDDVFEYHDTSTFQCPECDKKSDLSVEYTAHFTTSKIEEEEDDNRL